MNLLFRMRLHFIGAFFLSFCILIQSFSSDDETPNESVQTLSPCVIQFSTVRAQAPLSRLTDLASPQVKIRYVWADEMRSEITPFIIGQPLFIPKFPTSIQLHLMADIPDVRQVSSLGSLTPPAGDLTPAVKEWRSYNQRVMFIPDHLKLNDLADNHADKPSEFRPRPPLFYLGNEVSGEGRVALVPCRSVCTQLPPIDMPQGLFFTKQGWNTDYLGYALGEYLVFEVPDAISPVKMAPPNYSEVTQFVSRFLDSNLHMRFQGSYHWLQAIFVSSFNQYFVTNEGVLSFSPLFSKSSDLEFNFPTLPQLSEAKEVLKIVLGDSFDLLDDKLYQAYARAFIWYQILEHINEIGSNKSETSTLISNLKNLDPLTFHLLSFAAKVRPETSNWFQSVLVEHKEDFLPVTWIPVNTSDVSGTQKVELGSISKGTSLVWVNAELKKQTLIYDRTLRTGDTLRYIFVNEAEVTFSIDAFEFSQRVLSGYILAE